MKQTKQGDWKVGTCGGGSGSGGDGLVRHTSNLKRWKRERNDGSSLRANWQATVDELGVVQSCPRERERDRERVGEKEKERGSWNRKCLAADKSTAVLKVHHTAVRDRADIGWSYVSFCFLLILLILIRIAAPSLAARPIPKTIHYPTEEWLRRPPLVQTYKNILKISLCVLPGQSFSSSSANVQHRKKSERRQWQTWETAKEYNQHFLINIHPLFFFHFASLILHFPRIFNPTIAAI